MRRRAPPSHVLAFVLGLGALAGCGAAVVTLEDESVPLPGREDPEGTQDAGGGGDVDPPANDAGTEASVDAAPRMLRVFITSTTHGGALGGVVGGDQICAARATAASLPGVFRAWLSANGTPAPDRITSNGPWHLVNGTLVAQSKAALVSGNLNARIDRTEAGNVPPDVDDRAWTGTMGNGTQGMYTCGGWTTSSDGAGGVVGEAIHTNGQWTALTAEPCSFANRLYCFEL